MTQEVVRRRFTVRDYHRMGEAGILHEDYRVELIEGEIVEMAAIGTRHFASVNQLNRLLVRSVGDVAIVSVQNPARLDEHIDPQPDLTVLRLRDYRESLPLPVDVLLADRGLRYYARPRPRGEAPALRASGHPGGLDRGFSGRGHRASHRSVRRWLPYLRTAAAGKEIKSAALPELAFRVETVCSALTAF